MRLEGSRRRILDSRSSMAASLVSACLLGTALLIPSSAIAAQAPANTSFAAPRAAAPPLTWSSPVNLEQAPFATPIVIRAMSCADASLCVAVDNDGGVLTSTDPSGGARAWHLRRNSIPAQTSSAGLSCVTDPRVLCVAVDDGHPFVSTNPGGGPSAWHEVAAKISLASISCPSLAFCVGGGKGGFEVSADPTGGAKAWHYIKKGTGTYQVSCPSPSFCAAVRPYGSGDVLTSSDPGRAAAWKASAVNGPVNLVAISCPVTSLCVASDALGDVLSSTHPSRGPSAWRHVRMGHAIDTITCRTTRLCVGMRGATGKTTYLVTTTDPTGSASAWHVAQANWLESKLTFPYYDPISCASGTRCIAGTAGGDVVSSRDPADASSWAPQVNVDGLTGISWTGCPSTNLCVALDGTGNLLTSTDPVARRWRSTKLGLSTLACPDASLCVAFDPAGDVFTSTNPAGGASAWQSGPVLKDAHVSLLCWTATICTGLTTLPGETTASELAISTDPGSGPSSWQFLDFVQKSSIFSGAFDYCVLKKLCLVSDNVSDILSSTDPNGKPSAWHLTRVGANNIAREVGPFACPSTSLCLATDNYGDLLTSTDPTGGTSAWQLFRASAADRFGAPTCLSTSLCFSYGDAKDSPAVWFSTDPAGGAATWKERAVDFEPSGYTCPSAKLCVSPAGMGVAMTTSPIGGGKSWTVTRLRAPFPGAAIDQVACAGVSLCIAVDNYGDIFTGTPAGR
jgi:hypothetical protein